MTRNRSARVQYLMEDVSKGGGRSGGGWGGGGGAKTVTCSSYLLIVNNRISNYNEPRDFM